MPPPPTTSPSSSQTAPTSSTMRTCPFCQRTFKRLGSHLPHCQARGDASYEDLLSKKTLMKRARPQPAKQRCMQCSRLFKRLDTHLRTNSHCKISSSNQELINTSHPLQLDAQPDVQPSPLPSLSPSPLPEPCEILLLPRTDDDWKKADDYFLSVLPTWVSSDSNVDTLNKVICDGVFDYLASHHGTRSPCSHADRGQRKKHSRHNRELKRLRKDKVNAMRHLRQAQRERKPEGIMRTLRSTYLKSTRMYSKALKRSRRFGDERMAMKMKKECNASFWRFASKVLDNDSTSKVSPNFSLESAERFFSNTYSSTPSTFSQPSWLPTPTEPIECFDTDPIRMDEVISVIKQG